MIWAPVHHGGLHGLRDFCRHRLVTWEPGPRRYGVGQFPNQSVTLAFPTGSWAWVVVPSSTCPDPQAGAFPLSLKPPPHGLLPGGAGFFPRTHDSLKLGPFHFCFGAKNIDQGVLLSRPPHTLHNVPPWPLPSPARALLTQGPMRTRTSPRLCAEVRAYVPVPVLLL